MRRPQRRRKIPLRRRSRRSRRSVLLVFALVFVAASSRSASATCVEWSVPFTISTANGPVSLVPADLDRDGDLDVLAAELNPGRLFWLENVAGDGSSWISRTISEVDTLIWSVAAADIDGDGDLDALTAASGTETIALYLNDGSPANGGWDRHLVHNEAGQVNAITIRDLDRDGDLDVIANGVDGLLAWYESNSMPNGSLWPVHTISTSADAPYAIAVADFDGDGDADLLASSSSSPLFFANDGSPAFGVWTAVALTLSNPFGQIAAADIDRDGDPDAVLSRFSPDALVWLENDRTPQAGPWTLHTVAAGTQTTDALGAVDLDGDGDFDVLAADYGSDAVVWHENQNNGQAWTRHTLSSTVDGARDVRAADVDGDGDLDSISAALGGDRIAFHENLQLQDTALFADAPAIWTGTSRVYSVAFADIDRDGDLDPISSRPSDDVVAWFANSGGAGWTLHTISTATDALAVVSGDLDRDGDADVVASEYGENGRILWFAHGAGDIWTLHTILTTGAQSLAIGNLDGDGDLDVVSARPSNGSVDWQENDEADGSSWLFRKITGSVGAFPWWVSVADVDRDGDDDVLSAWISPTAALWHENDGPGINWTTHTIFQNAIDHATAIVPADVDGDGDLDAIASSYTTDLGVADTIAWYENDGTPAVGTWPAHIVSTTLVRPFSVAAFDLDGDGDVDALSTGYTSDTVVWHENNGFGGGWTAHTLASAADGPYAALAADLDGDGDLDVVSATQGGHELAIDRNRRTGIHDDGFDSDANTACWSVSVPPVL